MKFKVFETSSQTSAKTLKNKSEITFVIDESLGYITNYTARQYMRMMAGELAQFKIGIGYWPVLLYLWVKDKRTQGELGRLIAVEDATLVRTIDRMERDGLVRRQRDAKDRRQVRVLLTSKGNNLKGVLIPSAIKVNQVSTSALTEKERQSFFRLLKKISSSLAEFMDVKQEPAPKSKARGIR